MIVYYQSSACAISLPLLSPLGFVAMLLASATYATKMLTHHRCYPSPAGSPAAGKAANRLSVLLRSHRSLSAQSPKACYNRIEAANRRIDAFHRLPAAELPARLRTVYPFSSVRTARFRLNRRKLATTASMMLIASSMLSIACRQWNCRQGCEPFIRYPPKKSPFRFEKAAFFERPIFESRSESKHFCSRNQQADLSRN